MDKKFNERIYNISKEATKKGATIKLVPSGESIISQMSYKNNSMVITASASFVESMIKAFSDNVVNEKAEEIKPQPSNIIDMTDIAKIRSMSSKKRSQASISKLL